MRIPLPRPMPNFPPLADGKLVPSDEAMFRYWEATLPKVPNRRWWQFWRPNPAKLLEAKWRNWKHHRYMDSIARNPPVMLTEEDCQRIRQIRKESDAFWAKVAGATK